MTDETTLPLYLRGGFTPVPEKRDAADLTVRGPLPPGLDGHCLRNGPDPLPGEDKGHWFTGPGMLHDIRLRGGRAESYRNRWVRTMAQVLLSTAAQAHDDAAALTEESRHEAVATLQVSERGSLPREISELWPEETKLVGILNRPGERVHPVPVMRRTLKAGVRQRLRHVIASRDIIIWQMDVTNPVGAVNPCPSNLAWLMFRSEGRVQRLRVVFPGPERRASPQEGG